MADPAVLKNIETEEVRFLNLLLSLTTRFLNVKTQNVDKEINEALSQICDYFGFDLSAVWQLNKINPDEAFLINYYRKHEGAAIPKKLLASKSFPWILSKMLRKEIVCYRNWPELPTEAEIDKASRLYFDLKSSITFPMYLSDELVFGIISFDTMLEEYEFTDDIENKLLTISKIISHAVFHKISELQTSISNEKMRIAGIVAGVGFWEYNISTKMFWANEGIQELYDEKLADKFTLDEIIMKIHPSDREQVEKDLLESITKGVFKTVHRIQLPDGKIKWVSGNAKVNYDFENEPESMTGVTIDITKDKENEKRLIESEELKSSIINSVRNQVLVINNEGVIININDSWKKFAEEKGGGKEELCVNLGDNYLSVLDKSFKKGSKEALKHLNAIKKVLNGELQKFESEFLFKARQEEVWFLLRVTSLKSGSKGIGKGAVILHENISEFKNTQISLEKALNDIRLLKDRLQKENVYLKEEIKIQSNFDNILGQSDAIKYCLFGVEKVAPLDTTVLIYGETGTGKELIARAIHNSSHRNSKPLIKVDCSTLPPNLIESELFGREKGAYTDAKTSNAGRFELADNSTLFLDEIGELPLEVQSKLLRFTQYGEYERVGSSRTHKVNVRLIAATNRDLEEEVKKGRFREDLFFRLNVFRITVPPLRERKGDIPEMVMTFLRNINRKLGKKIEYVSQATLNLLMDYSWPGNVRELENKLEYGVITSRGNELELNFDATYRNDQKPDEQELVPLSELELEYIKKVLEFSNWKIEGANSASDILKLPPSTLRDKIKKLKIKRS